MKFRPGSLAYGGLVGSTVLMAGVLAFAAPSKTEKPDEPIPRSVVASNVEHLAAGDCLAGDLADESRAAAEAYGFEMDPVTSTDEGFIQSCVLYDGRDVQLIPRARTDATGYEWIVAVRRSGEGWKTTSFTETVSVSGPTCRIAELAASGSTLILCDDEHAGDGVRETYDVDLDALTVGRRDD